MRRGLLRTRLGSTLFPRHVTQSTPWCFSAELPTAAGGICATRLLELPRLVRRHAQEMRPRAPTKRACHQPGVIGPTQNMRIFPRVSVKSMLLQDASRSGEPVNKSPIEARSSACVSKSLIPKVTVARSRSVEELRCGLWFGCKATVAMASPSMETKTKALAFPSLLHSGARFSSHCDPKNAQEPTLAILYSRFYRLFVFFQKIWVRWRIGIKRESNLNKKFTEEGMHE